MGYKMFKYQGKNLAVNFIETSQVKDGVECDVYEFEDDREKDLGIIRIAPDSTTPQQLVVKGDSTIEGYISGKGKLVIDREGILQEYMVEEGSNFEIEVKRGEKMQWVSDGNSTLIAYEICFPPYEDGRFLDI